jgi:protein disulfide-isomerase A6
LDLLLAQCIVANIDADDQKNKPVAQRYGVSGFPTIKFFPRGSTEPVAYEGGRGEEDFVNFLNEKCGTQRAVGGGLSDKVRSIGARLQGAYLLMNAMDDSPRCSIVQAGRLADFDALASKFFVAAADARATLLKDALALAETAGVVSKHYIRVMEKLVNGTEGYVEKEAKRCVHFTLGRNCC